VVKAKDEDEEIARLVARARAGQEGITVETSRLVVKAG
jgi:hypothetical protein